MQNENKPKYNLGDLLFYFEEGREQPVKSGIYVGSHFGYYEMNPAKYGFDSVIEIVETVEDINGEDNKVTKIMPTRIEEFERDGSVASESPLSDGFRQDFAEFAGAFVEDRIFAKHPKADFAYNLFERYCALRGIMKS